jgi:hypothetical protein
MAARLLPSLLAVMLLPAATAQAGGIPPTSLDAGPEGVRDNAGEHRFTAVPLATQTVLAKSQTRGGRVLRASVLDGRWGVPVVAYDGTAGGVSADGKTLVLTRVAETYPRRRTAFAVVDTRSMAIRDTFGLDGEWRFDALSPDGRRVHLIEQLGRFDPTRTALRTYDLANRKLLAEAEAMRGYPMTRTAVRAGRWEYTLYAGSGRPFIHALDTVDSGSPSAGSVSPSSTATASWPPPPGVHGAPRPAEARHGWQSRSP